MGLFEGLFTNKINNRTRRGMNPSELSKMNNSGNMADSVTNLANHDVYKIISSIRDLSNTYKQRYAEYEEMANDSVIGSALELYADDATQVDGDTGRIVMITSPDKKLKDDLQAFLDSVHVDSQVWSWAYEIAKSGDKYLKVVRNPKTHKLIRFEDVDSPEMLLELHHNGVRVNFAEEVPDDERHLTSQSMGQQLEYIFYGPDEYIHFMTRSSSRGDKLRVEVQVPDQESTTRTEMREYKVVRGTSVIENARSIYRVLRLLEDSLLSARVAKAEYIRVYNVEVGANSTPKEIRKTMSKVKNLFDSSPRIDVSKGTYSSHKMLRPIGDPVFNPVQDGKGTINHDTIGGEFEVNNISDIDYFNNKLFAALKVPKAYLAFEESLPGGMGDNTLMLMDIRYSRTVKRISGAICRGVEDMCRLWLKENGRDAESDNFTVELLVPSSSEELQRLKELEMRIESVMKVTDLTNDFKDYVNMPQLVENLVECLVDYPELDDAISQVLKDAAKKYDDAKKKEQEARDRELGLVGEDDSHNDSATDSTEVHDESSVDDIISKYSSEE